MGVLNLGYACIEAGDLARWRDFARNVVGLGVSEDGDERLRLRMDDRPFRFEIAKSLTDRFAIAGWECSDAASFERLVARLEIQGTKVTRLEPAAARERCADAVARFTDPCGNVGELYWGHWSDYAPFISPAGVSGFKTAEMGLGHVVLPAPDLNAMRRFYSDLLDFGQTDEMWFQFPGPDGAIDAGLHFLHAEGPRHHALALFEGSAPAGCIHMMVEMANLDDVGRCLDRAEAGEYPITSSFGRHSNDQMLSFYVQTPSGFDLEIGCDGIRCSDWSRWVPTRSLVADLWGHKWKAATEVTA